MGLTGLSWQMRPVELAQIVYLCEHAGRRAYHPKVGQVPWTVFYLLGAHRRKLMLQGKGFFSADFGADGIEQL